METALAEDLERVSSEHSAGGETTIDVLIVTEGAADVLQVSVHPSDSVYEQLESALWEAEDPALVVAFFGGELIPGEASFDAVGIDAGARIEVHFRAMPIFAVGDYVQIKCRGGQLLEGVVCDLADVPPPGGAVTPRYIITPGDRSWTGRLKALWLHAERCWRWEGDFHSRRFPLISALEDMLKGESTLEDVVKLRDATQEERNQADPDADIRQAARRAAEAEVARVLGGMERDGWHEQALGQMEDLRARGMPI